MTPRIRLLCVDDHRVVREGLSAMIGRQPDMEVVALAATGEQAVELHRQHAPDITLMDLQLPTMSGLDAIRAIRRADPGARIIVLTMYHGEEDIYRALEAGAATYLLKDSISDDLTTMVREVHEGRRPIPPNIASVLAERATQALLSAREVEQGDCHGAAHHRGDRQGARAPCVREAGSERPDGGGPNRPASRHHPPRVTEVPPRRDGEDTYY
jgi:two-component system NarL family response regulator